jgi:predicted MFS family arabinose efflux permease
VVLSLSASSLYAGQALGGVLGGLLVQHGPVSVATAAAVCVLVALVVHLLSSARERPLTDQGSSAASVNPPVRSSA